MILAQEKQFEDKISMVPEILRSDQFMIQGF